MLRDAIKGTLCTTMHTCYLMCKVTVFHYQVTFNRQLCSCAHNLLLKYLHTFGTGNSVTKEWCDFQLKQLFVNNINIHTTKTELPLIFNKISPPSESYPSYSTGSPHICLLHSNTNKGHIKQHDTRIFHTWNCSALSAEVSTGSE